jgi:hypothetical protein
MADLDEQRRKVEELKRKILEQKRKDVADVSSSAISDKIVEEEKKRAGMAEHQALEVQRQTELASKRLVEETRRQVEEKSRKQQEEEVSRKKQEEEKKRQQLEEEKKRIDIPKSVSGVPSTVPVVSIQAYAQALKHAWMDGALSRDENAILVTLRKAMGISDQENIDLEQEVQLEIYLQAIVDSWKSGSITPQDLDRLDILRDRFKISAEEHLRLEKQVRQEILRQR